MASSTEIEAKFDVVESGWQLPELADLAVHDEPATELVTVYWDTADRRLDSCGVTLRRRVADGDPSAEWMVKLPVRAAGDGARHRQEVEVTSTDRTPPDELASLVQAMTRGAALEPIAELRAHRRRWRVGTDLWSDAVEVTHDEVTSKVGGQSGPTFCQVEVELLDHDQQEVMSTVVALLRRAGLVPSAEDSKLRRVLGPAAPIDRSRRKGVATIELVASQALGRQLSTLVAADPWIRLGDDVEVVHTCRKAVRRLRSDLRTLRPVLGRRRTDALRDDLKWYGALLGEVRDLHVLRQHLVHAAAGAGVPPTDREAIVAVLESRLTTQRRNLLSAMDGDRYLSVIDRLCEFQHAVPLRSGVDAEDPANEVLARAGRTSWKKVMTAHRDVLEDPTSERLHTLRKKTKQARAAAQLAKRAGSSTKKFTRAAGRLKDDLGDLHDADVLIEWLDDVAGRLGPPAAFSAGRLRELSVQRRAELDQVWTDSWEQLDRGRLRRWIS